MAKIFVWEGELLNYKAQIVMDNAIELQIYAAFV